jgi:hypothetical protein
LPVGGASVIIIVLFFKTPATFKPVEATAMEKAKQMDFLGNLLIIASTVCFLLAMQWGGITKEWGSGAVITVLVLFPLLAFLFLMNEWWQGDNAQLRFSILKHRTVLVPYIFAFL